MHRHNTSKLQNVKTSLCLRVRMFDSWFNPPGNDTNSVTANCACLCFISNHLSETNSDKSIWYVIETLKQPLYPASSKTPQNMQKRKHELHIASQCCRPFKYP